MWPHLQCSRPTPRGGTGSLVRRRHSVQATEQPSSHSHTRGMSCRARSRLCVWGGRRPEQRWGGVPVPVALCLLSACVSWSPVRITSCTPCLGPRSSQVTSRCSDPGLRPRAGRPLSPCLSSADHLPELPAHPNPRESGQSGSGPAAPLQGRHPPRRPGGQLQAGGRDCECPGPRELVWALWLGSGQLSVAGLSFCWGTAAGCHTSAEFSSLEPGALGRGKVGPAPGRAP